MFWRLTASEYTASSRSRNRAALQGLVETGAPPPGLIAYRDGQPAGWISVGPRAGYRRLARSRHFTAVDDQPVFSVICLRVAPVHRGAGVSLALVHGAVTHARSYGAAAVEAYLGPLLVLVDSPALGGEADVVLRTYVGSFHVGHVRFSLLGRGQSSGRLREIATAGMAT